MTAVEDAPVENESAFTVSAKAGITVAGAFVLFAVSALLWPRWWELPYMPTAEQWSAFFGASALAALAFAWYQIRQVDRSNRLVVEANKAQQLASTEASRPRVVVSIEVEMFTGRWMPTNKGSVFARVVNIGASPALGLRFRVDKPFDVPVDRFSLGDDEDAQQFTAEGLADANGAFSGGLEIPVLHPGKYYQWRIGLYPDVFEPDARHQRRYEIKLDYSSPIGHRYTDHSTVDFDLERYGGVY